MSETQDAIGKLTFVDDTGGALASLGVSLAMSRGVSARALTSAPARGAPEVAAVLAEIGVRPVMTAAQLGAPPPASGTLVVLGRSPIAGAAPTIDVGLYDGPPQSAFGDVDLERHAMARIARDRIERWLDQRP